MTLILAGTGRRPNVRQKGMHTMRTSLQCGHLYKQYVLSLGDPVFSCSCSGMNHTAPQGSILGTGFPVGDIDVEACEGLLKGILASLILPTN